MLKSSLWLPICCCRSICLLTWIHCIYLSPGLISCCILPLSLHVSCWFLVATKTILSYLRKNPQMIKREQSLHILGGFIQQIVAVTQNIMKLPEAHKNLAGGLHSTHGPSVSLLTRQDQGQPAAWVLCSNLGSGHVRWEFRIFRHMKRSTS